jgi:hypothetical protein
MQFSSSLFLMLAMAVAAAPMAHAEGAEGRAAKLKGKGAP